MLLAALMGNATPELPPVYVGEVSTQFFKLFPEVDVRVRWQDCGEVNAEYQPWSHRVVLCNELRDLDPGAVRMIYAHELGHALIDQLDAPITGLAESAADEFAAWFFLREGWNADVLSLAGLFVGMSIDENPRDEHPGDRRRAFQLICLEGQSRGEHKYNPTCKQTNYERVNRVWSRLIAR